MLLVNLCLVCSSESKATTASDPDTCPILLVEGGLRIAGKGVLPSREVIEKGTGGVGRGEGGRGDGGDLQTRKLLTLESKSEIQVFSNPLWS